MEAAGVQRALGLNLSYRSTSGSLCGLCGAPVMGGGSGETLASGGMSTAGFSGRISPPGSRSRVPAGSGHGGNSAGDDLYGRKWRFFHGMPWSPAREAANLLSISVLSTVKVSGQAAPSPRKGFRHSASGLSCDSEEGACPVRNRHLLGLGGRRNSRARRNPRVSTSPAADMDSRVNYYPSQVSVGMPVEEDLVEELPSDLQRELMPRHVAIIMDGNSRWAKRRGLHLSAGHAAGAEALKQVAVAASKWGITALTVFAFSTQNWRRPQLEVGFLMQIFEIKLLKEMPNLMRFNFQLRFVGDIFALPRSVQEAIESAKVCTSMNTGMIINICLNYSGRADLVRAFRQLAVQVAEGSLNPADIDDAAIANNVFMSELGALQDPDLVIRTSGEQRISNFLLWQVAYSEFVFSDTLWPDFGKEDFRAALLTYQCRDRRYGQRDG